MPRLERSNIAPWRSRVHAIDLLRQAGMLAEGIIHVGANVGQERYLYAESGASPCIYVEPIGSVFVRLR